MKKIVEILDTNNYSINIKADFRNLKKINSYYPTFRNLKLLDKFLTGIEKGQDGSIILSGAYGTGKSYFTSIFLNILDRDFRIENYKNFLGKSKNIYPIEDRLKRFENLNYFIVFIDDSVDDFSRSLLLGVTSSAKEVGLDLNLSTHYEIVENKIEVWKTSYPEVFESFIKKLQNKKQQKRFFSLLQERDEKSIKMFKEIYSEMFAGEKFSPVEKTQKITSVLEEVEISARKTGYKGVLYVFDEFGRYLESNIKKLDVKEIQDMAEFCNGENFSTLFLITHKDLFQYSEKLGDRESRNEWEKVSGRFQKEHLIYEKNNVLDIIANILVKKDYGRFRGKNLEIFETKESLLEKFSDFEAQEDTKKFYPLDILTVNILPDLSQKLAQNERTLFAFLCGNEEKGFKNLMKRENKFFVTLADIYDYFEDNFKMLDSESNEYKTYINCKNILSKLKFEEKELRDFIKILSLIYIYNKTSDIEPTPEVMSYALGIKDISSIENILRERNYINYRRHYNHYKIVEDIDVNVDKEVAEYIEKKLNSFNPIETLEKNLKREIYYPLQYNDKNQINRYLGQYYLNISDLSRLDEIEKNIYEDGKIIYLLNFDGNENYDLIADQLKSRGNIFITSPSNRKIEIIQELKELESIERILLGDERYSKEEILKREIESLREEIKGRITFKINEYFSKKIDLLKITDEFLTMRYPKYQKINYELINKHTLTTPMKKVRIDILRRIFNREELPNDETYFRDTKAESSVARILLENTKLYDSDIFEITMENSIFREILNDLLTRIKSEKYSLKKIYEIYCSNKGDFGFRKGIFTFLLGLIIVENYEQISITTSGTNNELNFELDILDSFEKNPEKYDIAYFHITETEIDYFNELETIFQSFIGNREDKIYNRILSGMKNYVLTLPRYMSAIYLKNYKGLDRTLKSIFSVNNGKEFLLKEIPKNYRSESFEDICKKLYEDITAFENSKDEFLDLLKRETLELLGEKTFLEIGLKYSNSPDGNEIRSLISTLKDKSDREILISITQKIKGFPFENWRNEKDLEEYKEELSKKLQEVTSIISSNGSNSIKVISDDHEKTIDFNVEETMLGKMLRSKLESTIKNMGMSVSQQEKEKILAKILLEI